MIFLSSALSFMECLTSYAVVESIPFRWSISRAGIFVIVSLALVFKSFTVFVHGSLLWQTLHRSVLPYSQRTTDILPVVALSLDIL